MRLPLLIATFMVGASIAYKVATQKEVTSKSVFSWSFILIILALVSNTAFKTFADMFCYLIITIVALNDGYDMLQEF